MAQRSRVLHCAANKGRLASPELKTLQVPDHGVSKSGVRSSAVPERIVLQLPWRRKGCQLMASIFCLSALLFVLGLLARCCSEVVSLKQDRTDVIAKRSKLPFGYRFLSPVPASPSAEQEDGLALLDVVLVASVDGKFHALNRTSGELLWSMSSSASTPSQTSVPPTLGPLVRTTHVESDPDLTDDDDGPDQELYIVEPQSGDIYVMSSPRSPLQRLSLSMSQLVEMSPFSFSGDDERRVFVGKKETSLLMLELETGKIRASLNTECPWDPFEDLHVDVSPDLDLDDLKDSTEKSAPTEIHIGRTGKRSIVFQHHGVDPVLNLRLPHLDSYPSTRAISKTSNPKPFLFNVRGKQST